MRSIVAVTSVFALALLITQPAIGGGSGPQGRAEYAYTGQGAVAGSFMGSCDASGAFFADPVRSIMLDTTAAGTLDRITTTVTYTKIQPDDPNGQVMVEPGEQERTRIRLPYGRLDVTWPDSGLAMLGNEHYPDGAGGIPIQLRGTALQWGPLADIAGPRFFIELANGDVGYTGGFGGRNRLLVSDEGSVVDGALTLYLREAMVTGEGFEERLKPWTEVIEETKDPAGIVSRYTVAFHDALLRLPAATLVLSPGARIACGTLDLDIDGALSLGGASGSLHDPAANRTLRFQDRVLNLRGIARLDEGPEGGAGLVTGTATGRFDAVGFDFRLAASSPADGSLVEEVLLVALVLGALATLWKILSSTWFVLYTRLRPDAVLEHPNRALVLDHVRANPGCDVASIVETTLVSKTALLHHLSVLQRAGHVRSVRVPGSRIYSVIEVSKADTNRKWAAEDERYRAILDRLESGTILRSALVAQMMARFKVADRTVRKWLDHLERLGLVAKEGTGKRVVYRVAGSS